MGCIRIWKQKNGIEIDEVPYDYDYHAFEVCVDNRHVVTIYPDTLEDTEDIRSRLNANEDVRDWEDGNGRCIGTLIAERTGAGLRETLKRLQSDGVCYNGRLGTGADGTIWADKANGVYYEYETDDIDLLVDDMTDDELLEVRIVRNATSGHCAMRETRDIGDVVADQMEADSDAHYWIHNPSGKNFEVITGRADTRQYLPRLIE